VHTHDDLDGVNRTAEAMDRLASGVVFANLVDLDSRYGHRNDPAGYGRGLEAIDAALPEVVRRLGDSDLLVVTADHGNDPTTPSTDHSREYTPILLAGGRVRAGVDLGTRETFADVGATVADAFGVHWDGPGTSFLRAATRGGGTE
jgi:phosphopentomutase